jgi:Leucine-rich repeat (LRR) protein
MHGNVHQWCEYDATPSNGPQDALRRALRGGSFFSPPNFCCATNRFLEPLDFRQNNCGLRVARVRAAANSDRKAAEWLIARGAKFGYTDARSYHQIEAGELPVLPAGDLVLNSFKLVGGQLRSDEELARFRGLEFLSTIVLTDTAVSNDGVKYLAALPKLDKLYLSRTKITDIGLEHLRNATGLTTLHINETAVSDAGLVHLKNCKKLKVLWLQKTKVTAAGIDSLKKALPNCTIEWNSTASEPKK